jgi:hypothetical protein
MHEKPQQISSKTFRHANVTRNSHIKFSSESERQIDYLERNFLDLLRDAEKKMGKAVLAKKDRKTLQRIHGIIETNAFYLTGNNEVAGKLNLKNGRSFLRPSVNLVIDVTFHCHSGRRNKFSARMGFKGKENEMKR